VARPEDRLPVEADAALAAGLADPDPQTRRDTAGRLAEVAATRHPSRRHGGQPHGCAWIVARLAERIGVEPDPIALHAVLRSLTAIGCAQVVTDTLPYLSTGTAAIRTAVTDALSQIDATHTVIEELLAHPDGDIRVRAVTLLGQMRTGSGIVWLAWLVEADADPRVVGSAVGELMARDDVRPARIAELCAQAAQRFPADAYLRFLHDAVSAPVGRPAR
jgi:hypothetical protein